VPEGADGLAARRRRRVGGEIDPKTPTPFNIDQRHVYATKDNSRQLARWACCSRSSSPSC
jgi:hypothetical protein